MNVTSCIKIINTTPVEQALLFYGEKGTGKSEVIANVAKESGMKYCVFFLGEMQDAGDMIGLMVPDMKTNRSIHLTPDWFPEGDEPVLFHLDEINRAKPELFGTINNLVLRGELNGKKLPAGSRIIATINPPDDTGSYDVEEMDEALISRFNVYEWNMTYDDWRPWAKKNKVSEYVIGYLDKNPDHLHKMIGVKTDKKGSGSTRDWKSTDCRAWKRVSDYMNKNNGLEKSDWDFVRSTISGIIGISAATSFMNYVKDTKRGIDVTDILTPAKGTNHEEIFQKIAEMEVQEQGLLNNNMQIWFEDNHEKITEKPNMDDAKRNKIIKTRTAILQNFKRYLDTVAKDVRGEFIKRLQVANTTTGADKSKNWTQVILVNVPSIVNDYIGLEAIQGK